MSNREILINQVMQMEIKCSFCKNNLREDINLKEDHRYGQSPEYHFSRSAEAAGWSSAKTEDGFVLTFCPDHVNTGKELGIL